MANKNSIMFLTKNIINILSSNSELMSLIPEERIYASFVPLGTSAPYVVIQRTGITPASTKDGIYEDNVYFRIGIIGNDYDYTVTIADTIRNVLEINGCNNEELNIDEIRLVTAYEDWFDNGYTQTLEFQAKIEY